jgi:5'-methylthioinosine phosphorylase
MDSSPCLALVSGTGSVLPALEHTLELALEDTPFGAPSAGLVQGVLAGCRVMYLPRHGSAHQLAPHRINYRANIWRLREAGVTHIVAVNTVGGIHPAAKPGSLWLPDNLIDYTYGRAHSLYDGEIFELRHQEFACPYNPALRQLLLEAAATADIRLHDGGVYGCTQGPRLETAAEIRRMAQDGCDLVGMTGMPEAALAAEAGMAYASIAPVVNPAAGLSDRPITLDDIMRQAALCHTQIQQLLPVVAASLLNG